MKLILSILKIYKIRSRFSMTSCLQENDGLSIRRVGEGESVMVLGILGFLFLLFYPSLAFLLFAGFVGYAMGGWFGVFVAFIVLFLILKAIL